MTKQYYCSGCGEYHSHVNPFSALCDECHDYYAEQELEHRLYGRSWIDIKEIPMITLEAGKTYTKHNGKLVYLTEAKDPDGRRGHPFQGSDGFVYTEGGTTLFSDRSYDPENIDMTIPAIEGVELSKDGRPLTVPYVSNSEDGIHPNPDEGRKYDDGKIRTDLLPALALEEVSKVFTMGVCKYDDWNWVKGMKWSRIVGALLRHLFKWLRGKDYDKESGLLELTHVCWCALVLLQYQLSALGTDDRVKQERAVPNPKITWELDGKNIKATMHEEEWF